MAVGEYLGNGNPDGTSVGLSTSELVSLYGVTPVSQRGNAFQATSVISVSSNITIAASLTALLMEISATLTALGIWKGAA